MAKLPEKYEDWTPPWKDGEFDAEKAARLIFNAERNVEKGKDRNAALRLELDDSAEKLTAAEIKLTAKPEGDSEKDKEINRLTGELKKLGTDGRPEDRAAIDRLEVGLTKGLTLRQTRRLSGKDRDELDEDADALREELGLSDDNDDDKDTGNAGPPSRGVTPASTLKNGSKPAGKDAAVYSVDDIIGGKAGPLGQGASSIVHMTPQR